jgi:hypothetical protein
MLHGIPSFPNVSDLVAGYYNCTNFSYNLRISEKGFQTFVVHSENRNVTQSATTLKRAKTCLVSTIPMAFNNLNMKKKKEWKWIIFLLSVILYYVSIVENRTTCDFWYEN